MMFVEVFEVLGRYTIQERYHVGHVKLALQADSFPDATRKSAEDIKVIRSFAV
jgi:hypothetical protein